MNPFLAMSLLYVALAAFFAIDASLANLGLVEWFNGLRWLRVHFITLGILVETLFGILPALVAAHVQKPRPDVRWDIWLLLNAGLIALGVGIPLVNTAIIFAGGAFILFAGLLLFRQLSSLEPAFDSSISGRPFYLAGLAFLFLGITFGTGLWLGWGDFLHAAAPREVHLHANLWGFTSLTFAGLLIDLYPGFARQQLAWPRSLGAMLGLFVSSAAALVAAPWIGSSPLMIAGILSHHTATAFLVFNIVKPLMDAKVVWIAGYFHLLAAYAWILVGLAVVPISLFSPLQIPFSAIEAHAPLILVFGWMLQFIFALGPYILGRIMLPAQPSRLGGNWISLISLNFGTAFILAAILSEAYQAMFDAAAFAAWAVALLLLLRELWGRMHAVSEAGIKVDVSF